jgi:predicted TIM-barrel fold metal-dependent hydrolase
MAQDRHHKVMFGTNYPMITPERALRGLDELGLDDAAREAFLSGNARAVFRI